MVALANQFGYEITKEELLETLKARKAQIEEARANAGQAVKELSEDALLTVSGGLCDSNYYQRCTEEQYHSDACEETYRAGEWCWHTDSCDKVFVCYGDWAFL